MKRAKLIIAASDSCADMLYATKFRAPDAFVFVETQGRTAVLLSDLEVDRGRREARVGEVVSFSEMEKNVQAGSKRKPSFARTVASFLKSRGAKHVSVPGDFPLSLANALNKEKVLTRPAQGHFWPEREFKTDDEILALGTALRVAESGLARGIEVLKTSTIRKDGKLLWSNKVLTSEVLRQEMEIAVLRAGGEARGDTIVAAGEQACDPHERGHGPLSANQLIILDIFPRDSRSGYFGDITRTVVRGTASEAQRRLWDTCLTGQKRVFQAMKPGAPGKKNPRGPQSVLRRKRLSHRNQRRPLAGIFPRHGPRSRARSSREPAFQRDRLQTRPGLHGRTGPLHPRNRRRPPRRCRGDYGERLQAAFQAPEAVRDLGRRDGAPRA